MNRLPHAWRPRRGLLVLAVVGVVVAAVLLLLVSPRQRAFSVTTTRPERPRQDGTRPSPTAPAPAPPAIARSVASVPQPPGPDAAGRIRVPLSNGLPSRLPVEGVPLGWQLKEFTGRSTVELIRDDGQIALRLRSDRSSFAIYRDVVVDLTKTPRLAWTWKVRRLPGDGDVRARATDDQAAQVYVIFPRWPDPMSQSDVLGYVWDSRAPVDTRVTSPKAANVRIIVIESGKGNLDTWRRELRDVAEDYAAVFGHKAPRVGKIALMIDSNDTRSDAETLFGELTFLPPR